VPPAPQGLVAGGLPFQALPAELRPDGSLLVYYALLALVAGPAAPFLAVYLYFRFRTLRYALDAEGLTMRWGILFRREVSLTYARLQDIHLTSNLVERWLGLGRVQLQTASGSSEAEVTLEGVKEFEAMRDFLYARMRGARGHATAEALPGGRVPPGARALSEPHALPEASAPVASAAELTGALREVAAEVRALRAALASRAGTGGRDEG
jgi:putative membrane protein